MHPRTLVSPAEYLALERASATKHEYLKGEILPMAGAQAAHNLLVANLIELFVLQVRKKGVRFFTSDMRVGLSQRGIYVYPDITLVKGEPIYEEAKQPDTLLNPTAVIEVLSPSTENYDRTRKAEAYRQQPGLEAYLLVAQDRPLLELYQRDAQQQWQLTQAVGLQAYLTLLGCNLALTSVYHQVNLAG